MSVAPGPLAPASGARRRVLLSFAVLFLLGNLVFLAGSRGSNNGQPIAFTHAKHIQNGMTCTDCHVGARTAERATLPALALCLTCHEAALTQSAEEAKIRAAAAAGQELKWVQHTRVPADVYFSHRRHVQSGRLECVTCHGPMEKLTAPPRGPYREVTMDGCLECHRKSRAGIDCNDCHR